MCANSHGHPAAAVVRRPFFQRLLCRRCGTPYMYAYRRQIVHFARDCTGVAKPQCACVKVVGQECKDLAS